MQTCESNVNNYSSTLDCSKILKINREKYLEFSCELVTNLVVGEVEEKVLNFLVNYCGAGVSSKTYLSSEVVINCLVFEFSRHFG